MNYAEFLKKKEMKANDSGFDVSRDEINPSMFDFQKDMVIWALKKGKSSIFSDCGTGKTITQLEWADKVAKKTGGNVLIVAPLNVVHQTARIEASKFGYEVTECRKQEDVKPGVNITNYEMLEHFTASDFVGVVLDESSILKSFNGKTQTFITDMFENTPYKLACTATPSPNDFMELGTHAEFVGVMKRNEMLSMFFVHDGGDTAKWRLKGHCKKDFWKWVATWAICIRKPSDLGYDDKGYSLPKLNITPVILDAKANAGCLFADIATSLSERREARKAGLEDRCNAVAELVNKSDEQWVVWCDYNDESELLHKLIEENVEVKGSDEPEFKEQSAVDFATNKVKSIVSKPAIFGFGSNWQNCRNMVFCGLSDSYERFYQAVRRCWRYGQTKDVNVYIYITTAESAVLENIKRKQKQQDAMVSGMVENMRDMTLEQIKHTTRNKTEYRPSKIFELPSWDVA